MTALNVKHLNRKQGQRIKNKGVILFSKSIKANELKIWILVNSIGKVYRCRTKDLRFKRHLQ